MVSKKIRKRLMVAVISIFCCIAVMAVGVYAAQASFEVQIDNKIDIQITKVDGTLSAKRYGDIVRGTVSMGDSGIADARKIYGSALTSGLSNFADDNVNANIVDFIDLYTNDGTGYRENAENMAIITDNINFYLSAKDGDSNKSILTAYYVFRFEFFTGSPTNVHIKVTNNTTELLENHPGQGKVHHEFKYYFGSEEPRDWDDASVEDFGIAGTKGASNSITIAGDDTDTHTVYLMMSMSVERTNKLADTFTLGFGSDGAGGERYTWGFRLELTPESAS